MVEAVMFLLCRIVVMSRTNIDIFLLCINTELISMKFRGGHHYH